MDDFAGENNNHPPMDDYVRAIFIHYWKRTIPACETYGTLAKFKISIFMLLCVSLHLTLRDTRVAKLHMMWWDLTAFHELVQALKP